MSIDFLLCLQQLLRLKMKLKSTEQQLNIGTIFITGISASGKSSLGKRLRGDLIKTGISNVKLLDGEEMRIQLAKKGKHFGHSTNERNKVALEYAHIAKDYNKKGMICIMCTIGHVRETRVEMRSIIGNVMEVYLDCPVDVCAKRDYKGHYAKAIKGQYDNFIGITEPYQKSDNAELVLRTDSESVEACSKKLLEAAMSFLRKDLQ